MIGLSDTLLVSIPYIHYAQVQVFKHEKSAHYCAIMSVLKSRTNVQK